MKRDFVGVDSIQALGRLFAKYNVKRTFLVTGKDSYEISGAREAIEQLLDEYGVQAQRFSDFSPNPKLDDVILGVRCFSDYVPDMLIAIGGGSAIDVAKSINILVVQEGSNYIKIVKNNQIKRVSSVPMVAIPTTPGTGSESTHFSVIYIGGEKYSLSHSSILPDHAIVDPSFSYSLDPYLFASCAMDGLAQAIESYWAVASNDASKEYARDAINLMMKSLVGHSFNIDKESIAGVVYASHLSGKAINISKTTAPHAFSYTLTSKFGIPHGHAVALMLEEFFILNEVTSEKEVSDPRGMGYVATVLQEIYSMLGANDADDCRNRWRQIMIGLELETDLGVLGIKTIEDIELIVSSVNIERLRNNPVVIDESGIIEALSKRV